jgi:undecaprenyl-diphosphatase
MDSLITFGAKYLFIAVVLIWFAAWWQAGREHKKMIAWATFAAVVIAAVLDKITSKLYYDPRPFVTHHVQPLVSHAADNGFPSEHTLFSATLAAVIIFFRPKVGIAAFIIALVVGACRVAAHVHSPIDIAGGAVIGLAAGYLGYLAAAKFLKTSTDQTRHAAGRRSNPTRTQ